jgi:hypothetical protein
MLGERKERRGKRNKNREINTYTNRGTKRVKKDERHQGRKETIEERHIDIQRKIQEIEG